MYHTGYLSVKEMVEAQDKETKKSFWLPLEREEEPGQGGQEPRTNQEGVGESLPVWSLCRKVSLGAWGRPLAPETPSRKFIRLCFASHVVVASQ